MVKVVGLRWFTAVVSNLLASTNDLDVKTKNKKNMKPLLCLPRANLCTEKTTGLFPLCSSLNIASASLAFIQVWTWYGLVNPQPYCRNVFTRDATIFSVLNEPVQRAGFCWQSRFFLIFGGFFWQPIVSLFPFFYFIYLFFCKSRTRLFKALSICAEHFTPERQRLKERKGEMEKRRRRYAGHPGSIQKTAWSISSRAVLAELYFFFFELKAASCLFCKFCAFILMFFDVFFHLYILC